MKESKIPECESIPGFVNIPCSRRGFCAVDLDKLDASSVSSPASSPQPPTSPNPLAGSGLDQVDAAGRKPTRAISPDWQPSYVNLEDTDILPVLLASSRPADDSHDFWKPKSVRGGSGSRNSVSGCPVYDSPRNSGSPAVQRRSMSNSSGSDTQVKINISYTYGSNY